jgi:hypothetical protein
MRERRHNLDLGVSHLGGPTIDRVAPLTRIGVNDAVHELHL